MEDGKLGSVELQETKTSILEHSVSHSNRFISENANHSPLGSGSCVNGASFFFFLIFKVY